MGYRQTDCVYINQYGTIYRIHRREWLAMCRKCADLGLGCNLDDRRWKAKPMHSPPRGISKRRESDGSWSEWQQFGTERRLIRCLDWTPEDFAEELEKLLTG